MFYLVLARFFVLLLDCFLFEECLSVVAHLLAAAKRLHLILREIWSINLLGWTFELIVIDDNRLLRFGVLFGGSWSWKSLVSGTSSFLFKTIVIGRFYFRSRLFLRFRMLFDEVFDLLLLLLFDDCGRDSGPFRMRLRLISKHNRLFLLFVPFRLSTNLSPLTLDPDVDLTLRHSRLRTLRWTTELSRHALVTSSLALFFKPIVHSRFW